MVYKSPLYQKATEGPKAICTHKFRQFGVASQLVVCLQKLENLYTQGEHATSGLVSEQYENELGIRTLLASAGFLTI